ncbi:MAG: hypothetical protein NVS4B7_19130 [Ktedonobacteraceae bacterium]
MSNSDKQSTGWLAFILVIAIILALLGMLILFDNRILNSFLSTTIVTIIAIIFLIAAFLLLAVSFRVRRSWLEFALALFLFAIIWSTVYPSNSSNVLHSTTTDALFTLPVAKIQSDIPDLHGSKKPIAITVILIVTHEQYSYQARLIDVQDTGNDVLLNAPYQNAANVHIFLSRDANDAKVKAFADQLADTTSIYLFPTTATPVSTSAIKLAFVLPVTKIQSDLSILQINKTITVLLVVNHQEYRYPATLKQVHGKDGKALSSPYVNENTDNVSIVLKENTMVEDFALQLADATAIYLLP